MDFQEIIAGTVGKLNTFGTCVGRVKAAPMSYARISTDDCTGRVRGYVGDGRFTDDSAGHLRRRRRSRNSKTAGSAALHLRTRIRTPHGRQPRPRFGHRL